MNRGKGKETSQRLNPGFRSRNQIRLTSSKNCQRRKFRYQSSSATLNRNRRITVLIGVHLRTAAALLVEKGIRKCCVHVSCAQLKFGAVLAV
jgi:hypothetical protein